MENREFIYCLFSIDNEYNQPNNNLVAWFNSMPTAEELSKELNIGKDEYVRLAKGERVRMHGAHYRIEKVPQGVFK